MLVSTDTVIAANGLPLSRSLGGLELARDMSSNNNVAEAGETATSPTAMTISASRSIFHPPTESDVGRLESATTTWARTDYQPRRRLRDPAASDFPARDGLLLDAERGRELRLGHLHQAADPLQLLRRHGGIMTNGHRLVNSQGPTVRGRPPHATPHDAPLSLFQRGLIVEVL